MFACEVGKHFRSLTFFGRARRGSGEEDVYHPLPAEVDLVELPHYESLTHVRELARALRGRSGVLA